MTGIPDQVYLWLDHPGNVMRGGWDTNPNLKNIHFIKAKALQHLFDSKDRQIARLTAERDQARAEAAAAYERGCLASPVIGPGAHACG